MESLVFSSVKQVSLVNCKLKNISLHQETSAILMVYKKISPLKQNRKNQPVLQIINSKISKVNGAGLILNSLDDPEVIPQVEISGSKFKKATKEGVRLIGQKIPKSN
jgi:hypothetical protein